ncbi:MAG: 4a-hydroxytetrahydrobiopterin dehydratase [Thioalkalispiraceae bacterium]|jgi:4a-hydroxytetrahydrobiopterin dehydratase
MVQESLENLHKESCISLGKDAAALDSESANQLASIVRGWEVSSDSKSISRSYKFKNYYETISFVNAIAWIANQQDHHPDLYVTYNQCKVTYSTHSVGGLSRNDFICAARINQLFD